jgi:light-regulated signal transduction histidine kinase (bacteriophytochrome)
MSLLILGRLRYNERMNKQLTLLNEKIIFQNKELEVLNKNLQQAGQEKDKLFSIISHELRNPLFWFHNLSSMLSRNYKNMDGAKLERSLSSLNESAQNVYHLMDNLLFWSRSQLNRIVPRKSEFIVNDKIEDVFHTFKALLNRKKLNGKPMFPTN